MRSTARTALEVTAVGECCGRMGTSLSVTTSDLDRSVVSVEHGLEFGPTAPEDEPAGSVVALAVLVTAQSRQRQKAFMDRQIVVIFR